MRSRIEAAVLLSLCLAASGLAAEPRWGDHLRDTEIAAAVDALRQDPNLVQQQKTSKTLRWKDSSRPPPPKQSEGSWAVNFFRYLADSASVLIWTLGSVGLALALVWVLRVLRVRVPRSRRAETASISHVQNLDVRPASLPADVGAAAAALLAAGEIREALALLYRAALSRAIHRHGIAIAESSTEGEVLSMVSPRLAPPGAQYFTRLLGLWQRTVYAAEPPASEAVAQLCRDFPVLDGTAA